MGNVAAPPSHTDHAEVVVDRGDVTCEDSLEMVEGESCLHHHYGN